MTLQTNVIYLYSLQQDFGMVFQSSVMLVSLEISSSCIAYKIRNLFLFQWRCFSVFDSAKPTVIRINRHFIKLYYQWLEKECTFWQKHYCHFFSCSRFQPPYTRFHTKIGSRICFDLHSNTKNILFLELFQAFMEDE